MNRHTLFFMGILSFLFGCGSNTPYQKKNGVWYYDDMSVSTKHPSSFTPLNKRFARADDFGFYRGSVVSGSDGKTFVAFNEHYAKDKSTVYYCDTYRKGQEYYTVKYNNIQTIRGADAPSFVYLTGDYAKDKSSAYYEGVGFAVKDVASFEMLDIEFGKDKITAYFHQEEIKGSEGSSFEMLNHHYSKDRHAVYYSEMSRNATVTGPTPINTNIKGALNASFVVYEDGYAADSVNAYFKGKWLCKVKPLFTVLDYGYAKTDNKIFYLGKEVAGADAASFKIADLRSIENDAADKSHSYKEGKKIQ